MNATKSTRQVKRQLFPEKLWDLVHKPNSGVKWSEEGTFLEIERAQLEKSIGNKFRSQNFDSFIRQLHFYGFRKSGNSYFHEKFQRNQFNEVVNMKRKYSNRALTPLSNNTVPPVKVNATSQTSSSNGGNGGSGCGSDSGTQSIASAIRPKKTQSKLHKIIVEHQSLINDAIEGILDLSKPNRLPDNQPAENVPMTHLNPNEEPQAIDYSKKSKRKLMPSATVRSPSKTLSKNQQFITVKIGPTTF